MKHSYSIFHRCLAAMLAGIACLSIGSCADDNISNQQEQGDRGVNVSFDVSTAQENRLSQPQSAPATRAAIIARQQAQGLSSEDLATRRLEVQGLPNTCLIETTTEGINAVLPQSGTRASVKTAIDARFSSLGYRSATAGFTVGRPEWFYSAPTNAAGTLVTPLQWAWAQRYARFYAVYPEATTANGIALSPATYSGTPYLDFEVKSNITDQVDLMVACSGEVEYATRHQAPKTNLEFYHALTAVKIAVGQNLSWNKHITKVELRNACSKGRLQLTDSTNGKGLQWTVDAGSKTNFSLALGTPGISTSSLPNQVLVGKDNDSYTFYMLPQPLAGITLHIEFSDAADINIPLSGTWRPATARTYKLSNTTSNWNYSFTVTSPTTAAAYNETNGGTYTVESFRTDPSDPSVKHAVGWKIVGYQVSNDGGLTWETETPNKPDWLNNLSMTSRTQIENYVAADQGIATVKKAEVNVDLLDKRNKELKKNARGSNTNYYDLSTHRLDGTSRTRSTANSYVISHPGYYKIPLVYGNAITNGVAYTHAYKSNASQAYYYGNKVVLETFKDHAGVDIDNPWITQTNSGANQPDGAKLVWADEAGLVQNLQVIGSGENAFLQFEVPETGIKTGNAVVAVTKNNIVVWSWHLWFTAEDVLNTTTFINYQGKPYKFTQEDLGWKYTLWASTPYIKSRQVRVKVRQSGAPGGTEASFVITQKAHIKREGYATLFQHDRKDAFPGVEPVVEGSFTSNGGSTMSFALGIQNPDKFYLYGSNWSGFNNLWSMDNNITQDQDFYNDDVVFKTIYDPCPADFHVPAARAFTGFSKTARYTTDPSEFNVSGEWNFGWDFNNKITSPDATLWFPMIVYRDPSTGSLQNNLSKGWNSGLGLRWTAPSYDGAAYGIDFGPDMINVTDGSSRYHNSWGLAIRPVAK